MNKIELMAPAGDFERLKIAFMYGADAVYFGGQDFTMRANALNFSLKEISEAVMLAHGLGKLVYVTVNIVFHDSDIVGLDEYLLELEKIGVDGIIVSDTLVIEHLKNLKINLKIILSTQASVLNYESAKYWISEGVSRLVLAREASKEDIKRIKKETNVELEVFIHGSMCVSFSGKCVMSNYATNRDSNRGGCAQVCRWTFITDEHDNKFCMMPKDLQMVPFIKELMEDGVDSFKIEGRMRSIYYVATVVYVYRKIIDLVLNNLMTDRLQNYYLAILNRCANREATPQFYDKLPGVNEQYFQDRDEVSNQDFLGIVKAYDKQTKIALIEQRNNFKVGDEIEIFGPNTEAFSFVVTEMFDQFGAQLDVARHAQMLVKIPVLSEVRENDLLRVKLFDISNY